MLPSVKDGKEFKIIAHKCDKTYAVMKIVVYRQTFAVVS